MLRDLYHEKREMLLWKLFLLIKTDFLYIIFIAPKGQKKRLKRHNLLNTEVVKNI